MAARYASILLAAFLLFMCATLSSAATDHVVGDALGWATRVDYSSWVIGKTFTVGDNLVFKYPAGMHTVNEVTSGDYIVCSTSNYITTDNSGYTVIPLTVPGPRYFVCGAPEHCAGGMKLWVSVLPCPGFPAGPGTVPPAPPTITPPVTAPPAPTPDDPTRTPNTPTPAVTTPPAAPTITRNPTRVPVDTPSPPAAPIPFILSAATDSLIPSSPMLLLAGVMVFLQLCFF